MGSGLHRSLIYGFWLLSLACDNTAEELGSSGKGGAGGASDAAPQAGAGGTAEPGTTSVSVGPATDGGASAAASAEVGGAGSGATDSPTLSAVAGSEAAVAGASAVTASSEGGLAGAAGRAPNSPGGAAGAAGRAPSSMGGAALGEMPAEATVTHASLFTSSELGSVGLLLATDPTGNVFAVGETDEPATAGLSAFPEDATRAIVVAKYAPGGSLLAQWSYPGTGSPEAIAVTPSGTLVIIGLLSPGMDFGAGALPAEDLSYYVVWLDGASGEPLQQQAVPFAHDGVWLRSATSDAAGNIYVAGEFSVFSPTWAASAFVTQLLASGAVGWSQVFPGCDSTAVANDIELTQTGTLAIGGAFNCTLTLGDQSWTSQAFSSGFTSYNGFLAELSRESGEPLFSMRFGGPIFDMVRKFDVTSDGHYRILGVLSGASEVGGITVNALEIGSNFVADLNPDGTANWVELIAGDTAAFGSATSQAGVTYVAGRFEGPGGTSSSEIEGSSSFLLSIGPTGGFQTLWTAPTESNGAGTVAIDGDGGLWVSGELRGSADLGLGTLSDTDGDQYLVRVDP